MSDSNRNIVVYISAPLSGSTTSEWWDNTMVARQWCKTLWEEGLTPLCPHLNSLFMEGIIPYEEFVEGDLVLIERCDAVLMSGDWDQSKGACMEREHAATIGKPIFDTMHSLFEWVESQEEKPQEYNEEEL